MVASTSGGPALDPAAAPRVEPGRRPRGDNPWLNRALLIGLGVLVVLFLMQWFGPLLVNPEDALVGAAPVGMVPTGMTADAVQGFTANSGGHPLGTDGQGRDILASIVVGVPRTLDVGLIGAGIGVALGIVLGFTAGLLRGWVDTVIGTITDVGISIPGLAVLVVVASYVTNLGVLGLGLVMALFAWPIPTRVLRAQVLTLRERGYVSLARLSGTSSIGIMFREMLPNMLPYIAATFAQTVSGVILAVTGLEALGLASSRYPSLGSMISNALQGSGIFRGMWWWWGTPVVTLMVIFLALLAVMLGLDRVANPRLRRAS
ncbi:ABC transporter permease [Actinocrispum wychmicini]|uniref:Peptide/nickel transport system permease protein n=1 Tax=Actinocrispum wychmicini TaxID=1213861 RepID=A0A4R2JP06_9PSEU|nr:ABC transporter permease [Actinocrispum wychmicini]TCO61104.1 peptide/nickel transport system permease protein [Actinocrispum wychmicini]